MEFPLDPCQGQSDSPPVSLQEQQVTSSDPLRGQSAMPRVSAQHHNRGVFARTLAQHGVLIRQAGVESPEPIGRVERHGGLFKAVLKRMITEHAVRGFDDIKIAIAEAVSTKNNLSRNGGFSPSQWVFGTLPRGPGDQFDEQEFADLGPLQGQLESGTAFARRAELRASARRANIREDCGRRVARAVLRKLLHLWENTPKVTLSVVARKTKDGQPLVV